MGRTLTDLCPVTALLQYMAILPQSEGPLFVTEDIDQGIVYQQSESSIGEGRHRCNKGYKGHSFHVGAATTAAAMKAP